MSGRACQVHPVWEDREAGGIRSQAFVAAARQGQQTPLPWGGASMGSLHQSGVTPVMEGGHPSPVTYGAWSPGRRGPGPPSSSLLSELRHREMCRKCA